MKKIIKVATALAFLMLTGCYVTPAPNYAPEPITEVTTTTSTLPPGTPIPSGPHYAPQQNAAPHVVVDNGNGGPSYNPQ